jgi:two-component system response regulator RegA
MNQQNMDFLIVDDDPTFLHVLERALLKREFSVASAKDIASALQHTHQYLFSKAIIDLKLGDDSGLHLIRELKQCQPEIEIVILTGYSSISTAVEAIKLGATNYLCKPADANDILSAFKIQASLVNDTTDYTPLSVERLEWEHIQKVLQENQGNISATARSLGMHRRTLQRKLQKRPVKH